MHLNPIDIGNVDKLNIAQKLERRRRSVQLVLVTSAENNKNDHLKLPPPAPRRQSLGGKCRSGLLRLKMPCPPLAISSSSAPFLPLIVPKSSPPLCATSPVHLSSPSARADDTGDCDRLLRRRSAFSFASPQLPPLFLSKMESKKRNTGEANGAGDESASGVTSMVSSCNSRRELVPQSPLIKVKADGPPQSNQLPTAEVISDEEGTIANSFCAFARAQQKLAEHRAQLDRKLDVVSCHRMAVEMNHNLAAMRIKLDIDQLLDSLERKCHSPQSDEEKGAAKEGKSELTIAEVQKDFFPFIYAKAEQLLVDRRMANSFTRKLSDKK